MCLMLLTAADLLYGFVGIRARTPPELIVRQPQTSQKWPVAAVSLRSCKSSSFLYITLTTTVFQFLHYCCLCQEECPRLTLARFSSVGRAPTSATEPSAQLDVKSGTICRQTSDSQTCHVAV